MIAARPTGSVSPSRKSRFAVPRWISTYLRPRTDRGRMATFESIGMSEFFWSSLSVASAPTLPLRRGSAFMSETMPTR